MLVTLVDGAGKKMITFWNSLKSFKISLFFNFLFNSPTVSSQFHLGIEEGVEHGVRVLQFESAQSSIGFTQGTSIFAFHFSFFAKMGIKTFPSACHEN